jgi:hypothetical protein
MATFQPIRKPTHYSLSPRIMHESATMSYEDLKQKIFNILNTMEAVYTIQPISIIQCAIQMENTIIQCEIHILFTEDGNDYIIDFTKGRGNPNTFNSFVRNFKFLYGEKKEEPIHDVFRPISIDDNRWDEIESEKQIIHYIRFFGTSSPEDTFELFTMFLNFIENEQHRRSFSTEMGHTIILQLLGLFDKYNLDETIHVYIRSMIMYSLLKIIELPIPNSYAVTQIRALITKSIKETYPFILHRSLQIILVLFHRHSQTSIRDELLKFIEPHVNSTTEHISKLAQTIVNL